ncbi:MAG: PQQ-dependent sugar dehydrogenase [Verrucomicrobiaceae bacterium]|nr:PQQ-dependent sugar dehydrogenase [Verrucomicrobiaceae bacterium]
MKTPTALLAALALPLALPAQTIQPGGKLPVETKIALVKVAGDLVDPVAVAGAPDGSGRLFVAERPGVIQIVKDGKVNKKPFLDIKDKTISSFLELGLFSIAFHPKFKENGRIFFCYSDLWFNGASMIAEVKAKAGKPDQADMDSIKVLMQLDFPYCNHHGGQIAFGPDGYLYIGVGDGGWEGDVISAGQDLHTHMGKMLRIDVDNSTPDRNYSVPKDNPFLTLPQQMTLFGVTELAFSKIHPKAKPEIWAYGLRNPWTFSFDSQTGDLWMADIGQNHWEEINMQPAGSKGGENYGWKFMCGSHTFPLETEKDNPRVGVLPVAEYSHVDQGICVINIGVSRSKAHPSLEGTYFCADWGSGKVWGIAKGKGGYQMEELLDLDTPLRPTGSGFDEEGNLYLTHATANYGGPVDPYTSERGALWKLVPADKVPAGAETAPLQKK